MLRLVLNDHQEARFNMKLYRFISSVETMRELQDSHGDNSIVFEGEGDEVGVTPL